MGFEQDLEVVDRTLERGDDRRHDLLVFWAWVAGSRHITRAIFVGELPFTVDEGTLRCEWVAPEAWDAMRETSFRSNGITYGFGSTVLPVRDIDEIRRQPRSGDSDLSAVDSVAGELCTERF